MISPPPKRLPRDAFVLTIARAIRGLGAGALSIVIAVDLASAGYSDLAIGLLLGLAMAGGSAGSILLPRWERRWARRRVLYVEAGFVGIGGLALWGALTVPALLLVALLLGGIVTGGSDVSPLGALEQASMADAVPRGRRTAAYAAYNLAGYVGAAVGALLAGLTRPGFGAGSGGVHDPIFLFYALLGASLLPLYARLSSAVDRPPIATDRPTLSPESRRHVLALSSLFAVDAFGGGLIVNSLVAYYLVVRFDASASALGTIFFAASLASGLSLLLAVPIARRIGLIPTIVFTHLPSSVLLMVFAAAPTLLAAGGLWVARATLSQMDVPTRQAYTQSIVPSEERSAAAGYTTAARSGQALGAPITGAFLAAGGPWVAGPFYLAGSVKIAYDLAIYGRFRSVAPDADRPSA